MRRISTIPLSSGSRSTRRATRPLLGCLVLLGDREGQAAQGKQARTALPRSAVPLSVQRRLVIIQPARMVVPKRSGPIDLKVTASADGP
jgi:hypothetical protein